MPGIFGDGQRGGIFGAKIDPRRPPLRVYLSADERDRMMAEAASNRIAGAFDAAGGMQEPSRALYEAKHRRAQGLPPEQPAEPGFWSDLMSSGPAIRGTLKAMTDPRTSPFSPAEAVRLLFDPAGEAGRQVEAGKRLVEPVTQFNDPNVDPVKQGADLTLATMGMSSVVPAEANALRQGIKAYHASPHKFERFESRPGTGEGSNMFGPGTYVAENTAVSGRGGAYDRVFTRRNLGQQDTTPQQEYILNELGKGSSDLDILKGLAQRGGADFEQAQGMLDKVKAAKANIYELDIAAGPDDLFQLDKPLSEQPKILQAIEQKWGDPEIVLTQLGLDPKTALGADYFNAMSGLGQTNVSGASAAIRDAGYSGLSFLDQGSRGAGTGTRNHVVFPGNENLINITRMYANKPRGGTAIVAAKGLGERPEARNPKIFSPYSKLGQDIPVTETAPIYVPGSGPKLIEKTFDPMTLKPGDRIVGFVGDRSHTGEDLGGIRIGDKETIFKKPVQSEGGAGYMSHEFNPQDAVWASNVGPTTTQANRLSAHLKNAEGDVYGATLAMAAPGIDFSVQATKTGLETLRAQPLTKEAREGLYDAIDEAMAAPIGNGKDFPAIPDWPGVRKVIKDDRLLQRIPGKWRAKLMKRLDSDPLKRLGAPNMAAVRYAVTAPGQRNASVLESGHGWFKMGDEAKRLSPEEVIRGHKTYPHVTASPGGEYAGTQPMPVELLFPGLARKVRHMNASGQQRTASMQDVYEVVTPRQLERFQRWLESEKGKKLGVAGAVAAGLLTAAQADALFGEDQTDRPKA